MFCWMCGGETCVVSQENRSFLFKMAFELLATYSLSSLSV